MMTSDAFAESFERRRKDKPRTRQRPSFFIKFRDVFVLGRRFGPPLSNTRRVARRTHARHTREEKEKPRARRRDTYRYTTRHHSSRPGNASHISILVLVEVRRTTEPEPDATAVEAPAVVGARRAGPRRRRERAVAVSGRADRRRSPRAPRRRPGTRPGTRCARARAFRASSSFPASRRRRRLAPNFQAEGADMASTKASSSASRSPRRAVSSETVNATPTSRKRRPARSARRR